MLTLLKNRQILNGNDTRKIHSLCSKHTLKTVRVNTNSLRLLWKVSIIDQNTWHILDFIRYTELNMYAFVFVCHSKLTSNNNQTKYKWKDE